MDRARQRKAIADGIRPIVSDRANVRGLYFGAAAAIDDPETCHGARVLVGLFYLPGEHRLTKWTADNLLDDRAVKRSWLFGEF